MNVFCVILYFLMGVSVLFCLNVLMAVCPHENSVGHTLAKGNSEMPTVPQ